MIKRGVLRGLPSISPWIWWPSSTLRNSSWLPFFLRLLWHFPLTSESLFLWPIETNSVTTVLTKYAIPNRKPLDKTCNIKCHEEFMIELRFERAIIRWSSGRNILRGMTLDPPVPSFPPHKLYKDSSPAMCYIFQLLMAQAVKIG